MLKDTCVCDLPRNAVGTSPEPLPYFFFEREKGMSGLPTLCRHDIRRNHKTTVNSMSDEKKINFLCKSIITFSFTISIIKKSWKLCCDIKKNSWFQTQHNGWQPSVPRDSPVKRLAAFCTSRLTCKAVCSLLYLATHL